jgi:hypothetical protein
MTRRQLVLDLARLMPERPREAGGRASDDDGESQQLVAGKVFGRA